MLYKCFDRKQCVFFWMTRGTSYIPNLAVITQGNLTFFNMLPSVWLSVNMPHRLFYISLLCSHLSFFRPSHWWRSTPSSKTTSLCLTPSGWLRMTALKRRKKVNLHHPYAWTGCSDVYMHILFFIVPHSRVISVSIIIYTHSQCLHMEAIKPGQLCEQTFFTTSLRFSISTVKHDPLCWRRAEQSWAAC